MNEEKSENYKYNVKDIDDDKNVGCGGFCNG